MSGLPTNEEVDRVLTDLVRETDPMAFAKLVAAFDPRHVSNATVFHFAAAIIARASLSFCDAEMPKVIGALGAMVGALRCEALRVLEAERAQAMMQ